MAKVIGIKTRNEITVLPFNEADAFKAIEALIQAKIADPVMFGQILNFITNNSGVSAMDVSHNLISKKLAAKKAGK